jgi:hypothetical protein
VGQRILDTVRPDGVEPDEGEQARVREFWMAPQRNGMREFGGPMDPEMGALADAFFGQMAAPRPDDAGGRDERTAGQRMHDALADLLRGATSSASVIVTMTAEQFEAGTGIAHTTYRQRLSVKQALRLAGNGSIGWLVHNSKGGVLNYGRKERFASKQQADVLAVRDKGCAFPGCDHPPDWCDRHHIKEWQDGGDTDLDNLVLLCRYHHRRHLTAGWRIHTRDGIPWFIPPETIDPSQTPIRNRR